MCNTRKTLSSGVHKAYLLLRERDRLAIVLAAAMRTSAPVRDESGLPAWDGTRSRGVSPTAAGISARMCSMVRSGKAPKRWSSSYKGRKSLSKGGTKER